MCNPFLHKTLSHFFTASRHGYSETHLSYGKSQRVITLKTARRLRWSRWYIPLHNLSLFVFYPTAFPQRSLCKLLFGNSRSLHAISTDFSPPLRLPFNLRLVGMYVGSLVHVFPVSHKWFCYLIHKMNSISRNGESPPMQRETLSMMIAVSKLALMISFLSWAR